MTPTPASKETTDNNRAALYMVIGMAGFVINDAFIKAVLVELPLFQTITARGLFASLFLFLLARYYTAFNGTKLLFSKTMVLRTLSEAAATYFFLGAIAYVPLGDAYAILMTVPIAVTLGAALFLGEQVGWRRYAAITIGFMGVYIILKPDGDGINPYYLMILGTVLSTVVRDLLTRKLPKEMPSLLVAFASSLAVTIVSAIMMLGETYVPISQAQWGAIALSAAFIFFGYVFTVMTVRTGQISAVAPFRYTSLVMAIIAGWLQFGEIPSLSVWLGSAIIVGSGLYTLWRERKKSN